MVTDTQIKVMKQKRMMGTHQDRNQVTDTQVGVREKRTVRVGGELRNTDVGRAPGGWRGMVGYPAEGAKRDLRQGAVGLATHGVVAKKDMVPALKSWREKETSHMLASLGNLGRTLSMGLDL